MKQLIMYLKKRILIVRFDLRAWRRERAAKRAIKKAEADGWDFPDGTNEDVLGIIACQYTMDNIIHW